MTASGHAQALERFRMIQPFLEEGVALAAIARHHGIALRTARRWVSHYRAGGLTALTRPPRADKGSRRALSPALQELVEALALTTPRRSVAAMHRTVSAVARDRGETETVVRIPGSPRRTFIVLFWSKHSRTESNAMCGPGAYRPDPTEGITALAELPQPEIVPYSRNEKRQPCPRCGHSAYRDKQSQRTLHD